MRVVQFTDPLAADREDPTRRVHRATHRVAPILGTRPRGRVGDQSARTSPAQLQAGSPDPTIDTSQGSTAQSRTAPLVQKEAPRSSGIPASKTAGALFRLVGQALGFGARWVPLVGAAINAITPTSMVDQESEDAALRISASGELQSPQEREPPQEAGKPDHLRRLGHSGDTTVYQDANGNEVIVKGPDSHNPALASLAMPGVPGTPVAGNGAQASLRTMGQRSGGPDIIGTDTEDEASPTQGDAITVSAEGIIPTQLSGLPYRLIDVKRLADILAPRIKQLSEQLEALGFNELTPISTSPTSGGDSPVTAARALKTANLPALLGAQPTSLGKKESRLVIAAGAFMVEEVPKSTASHDESRTEENGPLQYPTKKLVLDPYGITEVGELQLSEAAAIAIWSLLLKQAAESVRHDHVTQARLQAGGVVDGAKLQAQRHYPLVPDIERRLPRRVTAGIDNTHIDLTAVKVHMRLGYPPGPSRWISPPIFETDFYGGLLLPSVSPSAVAEIRAQASAALLTVMGLARDQYGDPVIPEETPPARRKELELAIMIHDALPRDEGNNRYVPISQELLLGNLVDLLGEPRPTILQGTGRSNRWATSIVESLPIDAAGKPVLPDNPSATLIRALKIYSRIHRDSGGGLVTADEVTPLVRYPGIPQSIIGTVEPARVPVVSYITTESEEVRLFVHPLHAQGSDHLPSLP